MINIRQCVPKGVKTPSGAHRSFNDTYAVPLHRRMERCYRHVVLRRRYPRAVWFYCTSRAYLLRIAAARGIPGDIAEDVVHEMLLSILVKRLRSCDVGPYLRGAMKHVDIKRDSYS